jgi:hypothetical protein
MARAHFVKKAAKKNPVAKKGEPYYWWAFRFGGKHYRKTPPRRSQLTQSAFLSSLYELEDDMAAATPTNVSDLQMAIEDWILTLETMRDDCQGSLDNMPEGLQQGDTGQRLQDRIDSCDSWISEMECADTDYDKDSETETEEEKCTRIVQELNDANPGFD